VLTDLPVFSSAAGWIGPRCRVDHDISLLVPEIWARMSPEERTPRYLIAHGYLERCVDWEHDGKRVLASRLGWRITSRFVQTFCGRVLGNPSTLFDEELLRPELQDRGVFADGMENIVQAMRTAAESYFADGSIQHAVPPLHALLHIMRDGTWQGRDAADPQVRVLFDREQMLKSEWYLARLEAQQRRDIEQCERRAAYLEKFLARPNYADVAKALGIRAKLESAQAAAKCARQKEYAASLVGTIGVDPALAPSAST
jgi:phosphoenolpyruvate carboxykinase (diphosphate)